MTKFINLDEIVDIPPERILVRKENGNLNMYETTRTSNHKQLHSFDHINARTNKLIRQILQVYKSNTLYICTEDLTSSDYAILPTV